MQIEKWDEFTNRGTVLTTEIESLANNAYSAKGATTIDNGTNKDRYAIAELVVNFGTNPTDQGELRLYQLPAPGGSNFAGQNASGNKVAEENYVGSFHVYPSTSPQYCDSPMFVIPPCQCAYVLKNLAGQTISASGVSVTIYTTNRTIN